MNTSVRPAFGKTLLVALALTLSGSAAADVGPAPSCPTGQHSAYLYGRRCVKDGYHLEQAGGAVVEVADPPTAGRTQVGNTAGNNMASPPAPPPVPPKQSGGCRLAGSSGASSAALCLMLALALLRRKR
jgi:hypothetical protein